ncbi:MAG: phosphatase PAP2 family protein, partial [Kiritimatiellae bacterium]|nr:phosphatase PAP2 family protein [Kiritimatiellia bacterium]
LGVLFWVFGGGVAYRAGLALMAGDLLSSVVKNACCIPRPWLRDPLILPVGDAQWGAFGYSFPSGHASSSALLWGGIAAAARRGWLWIPVLAWIGLTGVSRVYLGVHTPVDVAGAWLLAGPVVGGACRAVR